MTKRHRLSIAAAVAALLVLVVAWRACKHPRRPASRLSEWPADVRAVSVEAAMGEVMAARGRPVLLVVYASWCPGCRDEMPFVDELTGTYAPRGLVVVALAREDDDPNDYVEWLGGRKTNYEKVRLLPAPEGTLREALHRLGGGYRDVIPYAAVLGRDSAVVRDWPRGGATKPDVEAALTVALLASPPPAASVEKRGR